MIEHAKTQIELTKLKTGDRLLCLADPQSGSHRAATAAAGSLAVAAKSP